MSQRYYLTTAIPYVNAKPHVGHALEFVQADVIKRYQQLLGKETLLLSGADENALKNVQAAEAIGSDPQTFVDENAKSFQALAQALNVHFDVFQKGSDKQHHYTSSQKLWLLCQKHGDIYKQSYQGLYCVGCEAYYTADELNEAGECFEHPGKPLQMVEEENYFFKLSKYRNDIVRRIKSNDLAIFPEFRKNEILRFLEQGLVDISISRSNQRAKNWGVPVPNDPSQRIYVWFDALNIYQSGIGFGWDDQLYAKWWPADLHVIGKGISRFHAVYWLGFLLSAQLSLPKSLFIHGYFTVNGQKMSKTLGNVIDPFVLIQKYGIDPLRYYFLREIPAYQDGDFTESRLQEVYTADLANGLGNLVARVAKLASRCTIPLRSQSFESIQPPAYRQAMEDFRFHDALHEIWKLIKETDIYINQHQPWHISEITELTATLTSSVENIRIIASLLQPFLPSTAVRILEQFNQNHIQPQPVLFPRL
jgi:methionyl-tRNA synthetase